MSLFKMKNVLLIIDQGHDMRKVLFVRDSSAGDAQLGQQVSAAPRLVAVFLISAFVCQRQQNILGNWTAPLVDKITAQ